MPYSSNIKTRLMPLLVIGLLIAAGIGIYEAVMWAVK